MKSIRKSTKSSYLQKNPNTNYLLTKDKNSCFCCFRRTLQSFLSVLFLRRHATPLVFYRTSSSLTLSFTDAFGSAHRRVICDTLLAASAAAFFTIRRFLLYTPFLQSALIRASLGAGSSTLKTVQQATTSSV